MFERTIKDRENHVNTRNPTNKEGLLDMFHNKKNKDHQRNSSQSRSRTIQLKIMSVIPGFYAKTKYSSYV
jgi:hypothetical protein